MGVITVPNDDNDAAVTRPAKQPDGFNGGSPAIYATSVPTEGTYRCAIVMRTCWYHSHLR